MNLQNFYWSGQFTLALRLIIGWTYFSAFWRRLILDNKLIEDEAGYIGEKFNHFLPNALFIKPIIEYLVTHPELLWYNMVAFTIVEAIVGFCLLLGLWTRLMSVGVILLALGILFGSGWLGTTCLDEWQIGILGIAGGMAILFSGGGKYALDYYLQSKSLKIPFDVLLQPRSSKFILIGSISALLLALYTNQVFHGGVYGALHNKSVRPYVEITNAIKDDESVKFTIFRTEGADVYGSFLIEVQFRDRNDRIIYKLGQKELSAFSPKNIHNHYVAKIKAHHHSMLLPLGAKANLTVNIPRPLLADINSLTLVDISGASWSKTIE